MTHPSGAGSKSRGHRIRLVAAMLSSALLVAALFAACGPSGRSATPTANQPATPSTSASALDSGSQPAVSSDASAQPSGVAASSADPLGSDLSNLDQLLNGMDNSLSQAGPSASGE